MRKIIFSVLILVFLSLSNAMAYDWGSAGYSVLDSGSEDEESFIQLKDRAGNEIKVRHNKELSDRWGELIIKLNGEFRTWKNMKPEKIEFFVNNNSLEILIIPSSFTYKGTDFIPHIPGGMMFVYDYFLSYNFRVTQDNYFLRINDRFMYEDLLCARMKEAVDDPVSYLKKREPEYFLKKLTELENAQKKLEQSQERLTNAVIYYENSGFLGFGNTQVKKIVVKRIIELKTAQPEIKAADIKKKLSSEKVEASEKEIGLVLNVFYNEFD